ncbi:bacteriodes thetaiotaomicron symbiotic chitinase [Aspergillus tubingensis]|uniref:bacteriodes thetaiotaomicron symbiotic chitinase n=1 Tax=Aspergillus tubingensis TaxID=5068 RepID=UPI001578708D|nr:bacteriodes thetaiotaomicron symbiotic chitinase [Aspergillus tubingensis]GFN17067.1 bacteriodes thetaiotaomicron symbiotic chitinase [Aspergillus tubingensis]
MLQRLEQVVLLIFCGTTDDFCGSGCQNGCDAIKEPTCSASSSEAVYIGYYEGWNPTHPCDVVLPENINVDPWTHLYYSFAGISTSDFTITTTHDKDKEYWPRFTALKKKKPSLKTYISVGGWDLGGEVFSHMVQFPGARKAFISSALSMMSEYGFDGIDIDWEYPAAEDRGGASTDTDNFVTFLSEMRAALGTEYGLTCTIPSSYWYLKGFNVTGMEPYVDYFNFMSYDIHGTWDGKSKWTSSDVNPHTNLTEISSGLDLLWRNGIDPGKVLLGLGFYGRSFTLADPSCNTPGCPFNTANNSTGGGVAGECTQTSGILSDYEINRIIQDYSVNIKYDETSGVNWMTWSGNQWVSFDNARTLKQKADFANSKCLGGLFSWALDMGGPGSLKNPNEMSSSDTGMGGANTEGGSDGTGIVYVGPEVFTSPTVTAIAPVDIIFPQDILGSPTVISPESYPTSLEVVWNTTTTVTSGTSTGVSTGTTRYIMPTNIAVPPVTIGTISYYNWNITNPHITSAHGTLIPSIDLPPVTVIDDPNPLNETGISHSPLGTRVIHIPPWPWSTGGTVYPNVTFNQGSPPGPTCTANCGHKCSNFCDGPCLTDCGKNSSSGFIDPLDTDPPSVNKCSGPGCVNGKCTGQGLCIERGCTGSDCQHRVCVGENCTPTACSGRDCKDGHCTGSKCKDHGCIGTDCNGYDDENDSGHDSGDDSGDDGDDSGDDGDDGDDSGDDGDDGDDSGDDGDDGDDSGDDGDDSGDDGDDSGDDSGDDGDDSGDDDSGSDAEGACFGFECLSWGCIGVDCSSSTHTCTGPNCRVVSCSGPGCTNGICNGDKCNSEDTDCDSREADRCTEYISSTLVTPASTYSITTVTSQCSTITACSANPSTITSTITGDGLTEGTITAVDSTVSEDPALWTMILDDLSSYYSMAYDTNSSTSTSSTFSTMSTSTTHSTTSTTTSTTAFASETGYNCKGSSRCGTFSNLRSFCDKAKDDLLGTVTYGTTKKDTNSGTCYTDGMNAGFGCGVFVEGDNCEMTGAELAAHYDHIMQSSGGGCKICGHALLSNGCKVTVNYVSHCQNTDGIFQPAVNDGPDEDVETSASLRPSPTPLPTTSHGVFN